MNDVSLMIVSLMYQLMYHLCGSITFLYIRPFHTVLNDLMTVQALQVLEGRPCDKLHEISYGSLDIVFLRLLLVLK